MRLYRAIQTLRPTLYQPFSRINNIDPNFFSDRRFSELPNLHPTLKKNLLQNKIVFLTQAQNQCIDQIFEQPQTLSLAETGSGKTLMYLLPLLSDFIRKKEKEDDSGGREVTFSYELPQGAIILTSTKELCNQIYRDLRFLDPDYSVEATRLGSVSKIAPSIKNFEEKKNKNQKLLGEANLSNYLDFRKTDIVIATPGQLSDLLSLRKVQRMNPKYLIIDEADQLLTDTSNLRFVQSIMNKLDMTGPDAFHDRKIILTAATFPEKIKRNMFQSFIKNIFPQIEINKSDNYLRIPKDMEHNLVEVENESFGQKLAFLEELIQISNEKHFIVFCDNNDDVINVAEFLKSKYIPTVYCSGNMIETERSRNVNMFLTRAYTVLVCSDSVNRGLHFDFPLHLVQFDCARNMTSLIHRIGRTGRLGRKPVVTSFIRERDRPLLLNMQQMISIS